MPRHSGHTSPAEGFAMGLLKTQERNKPRKIDRFICLCNVSKHTVVPEQKPMEVFTTKNW